MIRASFIYTAVTILLALVDAIRIKKAKGMVGNINHKISDALASVTMLLTVIYIHPKWTTLWVIFLWAFSTAIGFVFIRFAFYDPFLNLFRRMKIDYESPTTSSYVDQHTNKLSFWEKRAIGLGGWGVMILVHYLIFKS